MPTVEIKGHVLPNAEKDGWPAGYTLMDVSRMLDQFVRFKVREINGKAITEKGCYRMFGHGCGWELLQVEPNEDGSGTVTRRWAPGVV